jgi:hypothetical protein
MNRPTRTTFIGFGIVMTLVAWTSCARASDAANIQRVTQLSDRYNECVYFSAIERLNKNHGDISAAAEEAFPSCATEARQIAVFLRSIGMTDVHIANIISDKNAGIKTELRKMSNIARGIK